MIAWGSVQLDLPFPASSTKSPRFRSGIASRFTSRIDPDSIVMSQLTNELLNRAQPTDRWLCRARASVSDRSVLCCRLQKKATRIASDVPRPALDVSSSSSPSLPPLRSSIYLNSHGAGRGSSGHPGFCLSVASIDSWLSRGMVSGPKAPAVLRFFRTRLHSPRLMETASTSSSSAQAWIFLTRTLLSRKAYGRLLSFSDYS
jgi:hypothetical protein